MDGFEPLRTLEELNAIVGTEIGVSRWIEVDQSRIDVFADCTIDHQFIHVDPEKAKMTPFGGTIAHGFLTLSRSFSPPRSPLLLSNPLSSPLSSPSNLPPPSQEAQGDQTSWVAFCSMNSNC